ncbi:hypothetical protein G7054_g10139 [Neopestalotiopsis clavispora]|nr:hypothetical protein G7054_g10139 [Neopestalotiopsis clavispora]
MTSAALRTQARRQPMPNLQAQSSLNTWVQRSRPRTSGTAYDNDIQWDGDTVMYNQISLKISRLPEMVDVFLINETKGFLADALLLGTDPDTDETVDFPAIPWDDLVDDVSNTQHGYNFLQDTGNQWPVCNRWLSKRCSEKSSMYLQRCVDRQWPGYTRDDPFQDFSVPNSIVQEIRTRLLALIHIVGGAPGRSAEILHLRTCNYTGAVSEYLQGPPGARQYTHIYRFLPREVGELVVWYMWVLLPPWQSANRVINEAESASPLLFAEVATKGLCTDDFAPLPVIIRMKGSTGLDWLTCNDVAKKMMTLPHELEDDTKLEEEDICFTADIFPSWSARYMSTLFKDLTKKHLGVEVDLHSYRTIWAAIARRFILGDSQLVTYKGKDAFNTDETGNPYCPSEPSHRNESFPPFTEASLIVRFENDSKLWHRFLGLGGVQGAMIGKRRLEPLEVDGAKARVKRQKRLADVNLEERLRHMLGNPSARFRPGQEDVLRAIHEGHSAVLQVAGTGSGKSVSFMLPAYCAGDGTTVVIVPLVALREDLVGRCSRAAIRMLVWSPSYDKRAPYGEASSIVFVTPESATTPAFRAYLDSLYARARLDRIVVDECHIILDAVYTITQAFRPAFKKIGELLRRYKVQTVLLTATLTPRDQTALLKHLEIDSNTAIISRQSTSRKNISYSVRHVEIDDDDAVEDELQHAAQRLIAELSYRFPDGRIIIYCVTIQRTKSISQLLNCPAYFADVGSESAKTEILKKWIKSGRLIAATSALGLGLDVPNVRAVIHITSPRRLQDFAQESGRAGRDGQHAESVIIHRHTSSLRAALALQNEPSPPAPKVESMRQAKKRMKEKRARDAIVQSAKAIIEHFEDDMVDYLEATDCRRAKLESVMDGPLGERGCCDTEELPCDLCRNGSSQELEADSDEEGYPTNSPDLSCPRR